MPAIKRRILPRLTPPDVVSEVPEVPLRRLRLRAYISSIADLVSERELGRAISRETAVEILKRSLKELGVEPFRGVRFSEDIYEKELISLYVVAKYILRLPMSYLRDVFSSEISLDRVSRVIRKFDDERKVRRVVEEQLGVVDEASLSKLIRFVTTKYYLGVMSEEEAISSVRNLVSLFSELSESFKRMTKFFMAVILGGKIVSGGIRSRLDLEAEKKALAINLGLSGGAPSNEYVLEVTRLVYGSVSNLSPSKSRRNPGPFTPQSS